MSAWQLIDFDVTNDHTQNEPGQGLVDPVETLFPMDTGRHGPQVVDGS